MQNQDEISRNILGIQRVTWVGVIANLMLALAKLGVGLLARSQALVADGVHSLSDLATDAAILVGSRYWSEPADERHPYGHGRIETLINVSIGIVLAIVGIGIGWNALQSIYISESPQVPSWVAFWVAILSIGVKEWLFRWTVHCGTKYNSRALIANAWHHRSDALSSIPVAVGVLGSHLFPDFSYLDAIAALLVTAMLIKAAFDIAWPSVCELLETREDIELEERIIEHARQWSAIGNIHDVRSRRIGGVILVDCHMFVSPEMTVAESHELAEKFRASVIDSEREVVDVLVHIEPLEKEPQGPGD